jgi:hypothetical protein
MYKYSMKEEDTHVRVPNTNIMQLFLWKQSVQQSQMTVSDTSKNKTEREIQTPPQPLRYPSYFNLCRFLDGFGHMIHQGHRHGTLFF